MSFPVDRGPHIAGGMPARLVRPADVAALLACAVTAIKGWVGTGRALSALVSLWMRSARRRVQIKAGFDLLNQMTKVTDLSQADLARHRAGLTVTDRNLASKKYNYRITGLLSCDDGYANHIYSLPGSGRDLPILCARQSDA